MTLQWFDARQASEAGAALADKLTPCAARVDSADAARSEGSLHALVKQAGSEVNGLGLNFYQRAKLANAFKWRLIENGVEKKVAHEVTQFLVVDISTTRTGQTAAAEPASATKKPAGSAGELFARANRLAAKREHEAAIEAYRAVLNIDHRHTAALNNLGSALLDLGRFVEAEQHFRGALSIDPNFVEAHRNLGDVLRLRGYFGESESSLRRAIKLKPNSLDALCSLGLTLVSRGATHDAKGRFRKVLKSKPRHVAALHGMGQVALMDGRWDEAEKLFMQILEIEPGNAAALVAQAGARKMTASDANWLEAAEAAVAANESRPPQEAALRYAIGKYFDDVGDFGRAFPSFARANEILKAAAEPYDRKVRAAAADLIKAHSRDVIARAAEGGSDSTVPVFVVGMPRSGTSLVEQIIASHPSARGAGELDFWSAVMRKHESEVREGLLPRPTKAELAESYLRVLKEHAAAGPTDNLTSVERIVDKAPVNSDYLGVIHSVFPEARIIYVQRDPVDTCLSCYFQELPLTLNFALDLDDLTHYYKEHRRLIDHWRAVLPPGSILDVPYESLVADQDAWTRRIIEFVGLEWNDQCLSFEQTQRVVSSASFRQVRRKIYNTSVARWRNYEKFLGPLLSLRKL